MEIDENVGCDEALFMSLKVRILEKNSNLNIKYACAFKTPSSCFDDPLERDDIHDGTRAPTILGHAMIPGCSPAFLCFFRCCYSDAPSSRAIQRLIALHP